MQNLRSAAAALEKTLSPLRRESPLDPAFAISIDSISGLKGSSGNGRLLALNRIISVISKKANFWYFFLSSDPNIDGLISPDRTLPVVPDPYGKPWRCRGFPLFDSFFDFPPFTTFGVDIFDLKDGYRMKPAEESMMSFAEAKHMSRFGRPLWSIYGARSDEIARRKLLGGAAGRAYNDLDKDHVFAALSLRLYLDVNPRSPISIDLSRTAVHLYMRVVKSLDVSTGSLVTRTPAEPILSYAAMRNLLPPSSWGNSISTLTGSLLSRGAIIKGIKGELYARLLFTLAHDI